MTDKPRSKSMTGRLRRHLVIELNLMTDAPPLPFPIRTVGMDDADALAVLMADAYRDSVDPEWSDYDAAHREICRIFSTFDGPIVADACLAAFERTRPICACLARNARGDGCISYLMTANAHKSRGVGRAVLLRSLTSLRDAGFARVFLDVTAGNSPAEHLYESLGFVEAWSVHL